MEQLNSMFTRLKRGLYAGGDSQPPQKQQSVASDCSIDSSQEDEGFVLINQNEVLPEATVYTSTQENMAVQKSAPYSVMSGQGTGKGGGEFTMFATCDHLSMDSAADTPDQVHDTTFHPAVIGVPFQINPKLLEKDRLQCMLSRLDLATTGFDWQKYSYDFNFEQSSLRELCAMEDRAMLTDSRPENSVLWKGCT